MPAPGRIEPSAAPFLSALVLVTVVAFADGGYFRESWPWATVALACLACLALLVRESIALAPLDWAAIGALAAFVAWVALSAAWSDVSEDSLRESQRGLVYVAAVLAFVLLVARARVRELLAGVASGATLVAAYSLGARLLWDRPIEIDPIQRNRLIEPLGYANALGIVAALGLVLALGFAVHARTRVGRAAAAGATIPLVSTLTWTDSRGTSLALVAGLGVLGLVDARRAQVLATALALAAPAALAVWLTSRSSAPTEAGGAAVDESSEAGLVLALALGALALVAALASLGAAWVEARLPRSRKTALAVLGAIAVVLLPAVLVAALRSDRPLGPRFEYWGVAWHQWEENKWLGSGAATFAEYWRRENESVDVLDAHSLYVETLAELGPFGLGLLLCALSLPLLAGLRGRRHPLAGVAAGGYAAYLVHAGLDWDWEMPAVTLAGLLCGVALLASAREERDRTIGWRGRVGLALVAVVIAALAVGGSIVAR